MYMFMKIILGFVKLFGSLSLEGRYREVLSRMLFS